MKNSEEDIISLFKKSYDLMKRKNIREFRLEKKNFSISIKRGVTQAERQIKPSPQVHAAPTAKKEEARVPSERSKGGVEFIRSPLAGVFYKSPSPNSKPYISPPCSVKKGQTLCIIEAMKVMNEIESPADCEVLSYKAENGQAVEKDAPLFEIKKKV